MAEYRGHSDSVAALAAAPGGARFASGGWDGAVHVWDTGTATVEAAGRAAAEGAAGAAKRRRSGAGGQVADAPAVLQVPLQTFNYSNYVQSLRALLHGKSLLHLHVSRVCWQSLSHLAEFLLCLLAFGPTQSQRRLFQALISSARRLAQPSTGANIWLRAGDSVCAAAGRASTVRFRGCLALGGAPGDWVLGPLGVVPTRHCLVIPRLTNQLLLSKYHRPVQHLQGQQVLWSLCLVRSLYRDQGLQIVRMLECLRGSLKGGSPTRSGVAGPGAGVGRGYGGEPQHTEPQQGGTLRCVSTCGECHGCFRRRRAGPAAMGPSQPE